MIPCVMAGWSVTWSVATKSLMVDDYHTIPYIVMVVQTTKPVTNKLNYNNRIAPLLSYRSDSTTFMHMLASHTLLRHTTTYTILFTYASMHAHTTTHASTTTHTTHILLHIVCSRLSLCLVSLTILTWCHIQTPIERCACVCVWCSCLSCYPLHCRIMYCIVLLHCCC